MFFIILTHTVFAMFRVSSEGCSEWEVGGEGMTRQNRGQKPSAFDVAYYEVTH
jgi:hypothetical protein